MVAIKLFRLDCRRSRRLASPCALEALVRDPAVPRWPRPAARRPASRARAHTSAGLRRGRLAGPAAAAPRSPRRSTRRCPAAARSRPALERRRRRRAVPRRAPPPRHARSTTRRWGARDRRRHHAGLEAAGSACRRSARPYAAPERLAGASLGRACRRVHPGRPRAGARRRAGAPLMPESGAALQWLGLGDAERTAAVRAVLTRAIDEDPACTRRDRPWRGPRCGAPRGTARRRRRRRGERRTRDAAGARRPGRPLWPGRSPIWTICTLEAAGPVREEEPLAVDLPLLLQADASEVPTPGGRRLPPRRGAAAARRRRGGRCVFTIRPRAPNPCCPTRRTKPRSRGWRLWLAVHRAMPSPSTQPGDAAASRSRVETEEPPADLPKPSGPSRRRLEIAASGADGRGHPRRHAKVVRRRARPVRCLGAAVAGLAAGVLYRLTGMGTSRSGATPRCAAGIGPGPSTSAVLATMPRAREELRDEPVQGEQGTRGALPADGHRTDDDEPPAHVVQRRDDVGSGASPGAPDRPPRRRPRKAALPGHGTAARRRGGRRSRARTSAATPTAKGRLLVRTRRRARESGSTAGTAACRP